MLVAGSENAVERNIGDPAKNLEECKAKDNAEAPPKEETKTPKREERPVLGQQQQGKPSRTDCCNCPEVSIARVLGAKVRASL